MVSDLVSIPGYCITEELYNGSRTLVYRGYREIDSLRVAIKLLKNSYPTFNELLLFRNQYTITKNLNSPLIVQTYSLEPYQNGYALVMEDFGGISLKEWSLKVKRLSLEEFLVLAIRLCNTLDVLYRERIIHKDIKPSNILINPETKEVKIIDFSIASLLPKENQTPSNSHILEGTLSYISPEQTGRMNRGIDYRTDFYSLGVTFYELLTGKLPFSATEPMELIHSHIAKIAPSVHEIDSKIPLVISKIIRKLMAKNAEDRYQSALGLRLDLEKCWHQLQETGRISDFAIAQMDACERFMIPDKLYGRETEVLTLLETFERVSLGATEMILVAGCSGIGKTAVVSEVQKPIVRQRGYFIKGKYDQFQRNIPFVGFVQAFRDLMGQLLSESDVQLEQWKNKILEAVGENGQVIIEVIPELSRIIGSQPPVVELSGTAAQNRFNLLFQKFTQVFTSAEHPLVIFLDDLQWADLASLKLIQLLMADTGHFLLIGAYRDNEINPAHPFMLTVSELQKTRAKIQTITLAPLNREQINQLVAETLKCQETLAWELSPLLYQKTQGNPFFATQFLKALHQEELIQFNFELGCWQCDIAQVTTQAVTDDVVAFMALQLGKLPASTQQVLQLAACIGNQFDIATLAIVSQHSEVETAATLWKALQEGLIVPLSDVYKFYQTEAGIGLVPKHEESAQQIAKYRFLHDRVQQAAYSLIADNQKQTTHYQIGQLLLQQISPEALEERIFEVVNQLNHGVSLINQQTQREQLAQLNLIACRKARAATAYQAAREYVAVGLSLLGEQAWQHHYEMTLAFHELAAEVAMLCGDFEAMEQFIDAVIAQAHSLLEQVHVYCIRIQSHASQSKFSSAIAICETILQQLGVTFHTPTPTDIQQAIQEIEELIADKQIEDLVHLNVMTEAEKLAILQVTSSILSTAHIIGSPLLPLLVLLSVKLSIQYGNTSVSAYTYVMYGMVLCNLVNDVETAVKFGRLALQVVYKLDAKAIKPEVLAVLGGFLLHRKSHIKEMLPLAQEGYAIGLEVGNLEFAGNNAINFCNNSFWCSQPLAILEQEARTYSNGCAQLHHLASANRCRIFWQSVLNLLGCAEHPTILSGEALQETEFLPVLLAANDLFALYCFYVSKLMLCFLFGEIEQANNHALLGRNYLIAGAGFVGEPAFYFYDSLIALAQLSQPSDHGSTVLERVAQNQTQLQYWAHYAPMNHQHKVDLVEAEKCRVLGQIAQAIELYDKAISGAKSNEYTQEEALANELAAKFYLGWGKQRIAREYMTQAYYDYARWGAKAKVADLERRYPQLLAPILQQTRSSVSLHETISALGSAISTSSATSSNSVSDLLDLKAILKASQTLSSEIELEKLLSSLLSIVIENAGAEKCVLMLLQNNHLLIKGSITQGREPVVFEHLVVEDTQEVPLKLIYKVKHNRQTVVLHNAMADPTLANDPYIIRQQPKSILCGPILHQGKLMGILYLENNLAKEAFTNNCVELLNLLCTQAAISLENAKLFYESKQAEIKLQQSNAFLEAQRESSLDGILVVDKDRQISSYNQGFLDLWRVPPELRNTRDDRAMLAFVVEKVADPQAFLDRVLYLYEHINESSHCELLLKDGRTIERTSVPVNSGNQENWGRIWYFRDISDRKQTEAALQQKEQFLRSIYDGSEILIIVTDVMEDGSFRYAGLNPTAEKICGVREIDVLGKTPFEVYGEEVGRAIENILVDCVESRIPISTENLLTMKGEEKWFLATHNPLKNENGQICRIITTTIDISDRKRAELALQQKSLELEHALHNLQNAQLQIVQSEKMSALGNLVAGVAHEMNNPLGFIAASIKQAKPMFTDIVEHLKLYQETFPDSSEPILVHAEEIDLEYSLEDLPKMLDSMSIACDRLKNISTSLRTFSRADRDYKVPFNIHQGIDSTILILKHRLKANEQHPLIEVVTNYGNVPQIECFPGQLNQVFMNILANAIDALEESNNGRTLTEIQASPNRIKITTSVENNIVKIAIADNGKGMSEEVQQKIFDHSFTTKAVGKGTGLGLAIARQIVEETHGGKLYCYSVLGEGTEFTITLPTTLAPTS